MLELLVGMVFLSLVLVPITLVVWLLVYAVRSDVRVGVCRACQYDLRGLGGQRRCPECGQPFSINAQGEVISGGLFRPAYLSRGPNPAGSPIPDPTSDHHTHN